MLNQGSKYTWRDAPERLAGATFLLANDRCYEGLEGLIRESSFLDYIHLTNFRTPYRKRISRRTSGETDGADHVAQRYRRGANEVQCREAPSDQPTTMDCNRLTTAAKRRALAT